MAPWGAAVTDALEAIAGQEVIDEVFDRGLLEVLPLTHIRGRSLTDSFVIIDEAQNLERPVLLTALSAAWARAAGSCSPTTSPSATTCGSAATTASPRSSRRLKGHPLFGHVTLTRAERSPVAALVTQVLDGIVPHEPVPRKRIVVAARVRFGARCRRSDRPSPGRSGWYPAGTGEGRAARDVSDS